MKHWTWVGLLALVYFLAAFFAVRDNTFVIDDLAQIHEGIKNFTHPSTILEPDYAGRKHIVTSLFLGAVHTLFGTNPFPYHVSLLVFHAMIFLLLIFLGLSVGLDRRGAALGALFFLILGIHFQAVAWIGNITRVLMTLFLLLAFLCFGRFRKTGNPLPLFGFWAFWVLGLQSSPDAVVLPVLLGGYDFLILRRNLFSKKNRKGLWLYGAMALSAALYLFSQLFFYSGLRFVDGLTSGHFQWGRRVAGVLWALANLFIPRREILEPWIEPTSFHRILIPAVALLPFPWLLFRSRGLLLKDKSFRSIALFSFLWFVIAFLPFAALNRTAPWREFPPARYFYIPLIGLSLFVGKAGEIVLNTVADLRSKNFRRAVLSWISLAGIFFYLMNVSTFCFMADKLDLNWRVKRAASVEGPTNPQ